MHVDLLEQVLSAAGDQAHGRSNCASPPLSFEAGVSY